MSEATKMPNTLVRETEISLTSSLEPSLQTETSTLSTATSSATSAATQEDRGKTLSETQQDLGDTAATIQHDQGESPSKTIWRNVANVCCWKSATDRLGAPLDEGETRAIEMKVEDFREEEISDAVTSRERETSVSTSGPQLSTSGSTSRPSASGSTSQSSTSESTSRSESRTSGSTSPVNMFPGTSRFQQETYECMRDPEHEMMEARLYDEKMARIMAVGYVPKEEIRQPSAPGFTSQPSDTEHSAEDSISFVSCANTEYSAEDAISFASCALTDVDSIYFTPLPYMTTDFSDLVAEEQTYTICQRFWVWDIILTSIVIMIITWLFM